MIECPVCNKKFGVSTVDDAFWHSISTKESGFIDDVCENCFENCTDEELLSALGKDGETIVW